MFSKFSEEAQKSLLLAREEMIKLRHPYIGSEHLLLAILSNKNLPITKMLSKYNINYENFYNEIIKIMGKGTKVSSWFLYTPLLKRIIENATFDSKERKEKEVTIEQLFLSLGNKVQIISKENKSLYHAAAVTVSNFILGLVNNSLTYLKDCGFSEELAMEALYPLIEFNLKNIKENGIMESLTGPVERGDLETITSHCKVLNQQDKKMYKLLSENILSIAEMKNKQRNYEKIREYLKR